MQIKCTKKNDIQKSVCHFVELLTHIIHPTDPSNTHHHQTENADRFSQSASHFLSSPVQAEHIDLS